jgi:hypothetical protein
MLAFAKNFFDGDIAVWIYGPISSRVTFHDLDGHLRPQPEVFLSSSARRLMY